MTKTKRPTPSACLIGERVEIKPAFSCETGERSIWDDIAGCCAHVTAVNSDGYVMVQILNGDEVEVSIERLTFRKAA